MRRGCTLTGDSLPPPPQATCERGFAAMEETHQKVVQDLQRQHQREISKLMEERERLLAEETAATIAGNFLEMFLKVLEAATGT